MTQIGLGRTVIVVPEGLSSIGALARTLPKPSFVYRAVLDHVAATHGDATIILAPANDFGTHRIEHAAAANYLNACGSFCIVVPASPSGTYIDTRGKARLLREYLEDEGCWPLSPAILVSGIRHAHRASLCFRREGFALLTVEAVPYRIPTDEAIVRRLWYYRYPAWHKLYEALAYIRDFLRPEYQTK